GQPSFGFGLWSACDKASFQSMPSALSRCILGPRLVLLRFLGIVCMYPQGSFCWIRYGDSQRRRTNFSVETEKARFSSRSSTVKGMQYRNVLRDCCCDYDCVSHPLQFMHTGNICGKF